MVNTVSCAEVAQVLQSGGFLLDVREETEWRAGRTAEAMLIPLAELPDRLDQLPKGQVILCICRSGGRSLRAATYLTEVGFDVLNVEGGMLDWQKSGLPLVGDGPIPSVV